MVSAISDGGSLGRLFAGLTEHAFQVELGIADPALTDYVAGMLERFLRTDSIYRVRNAFGRRLRSVAEMLIEAEKRQAGPRREMHRHIGDFTLFWCGLYPESLQQVKAAGDGTDRLLDYASLGKQSYLIASTYEVEPYDREAPVLRKLSAEFELCTMGLRFVRQVWEQSRGPDTTLAGGEEA